MDRAIDKKKNPEPPKENRESSGSVSSCNPAEYKGQDDGLRKSAPWPGLVTFCDPGEYEVKGEESKPREDHSTVPSKPNQSSGRIKKPWHGLGEKIPDNFFRDALIGSLWQIAWALGNAGIITDVTPASLKPRLKVLDPKAQEKKSLWGQCEGKVYYVYVTKNLSEQLDRAHTELKKIQERGPYHHEKHSRPKRYQRDNYFVIGASQETLALVLYEGGILKDEKVTSLHDKIKEEGILFGVYKEMEDLYLIYFDKEQPKNVIDKVQKLMKSKKHLPH